MVRVAGLVATAKSRSLGEDPQPCLYFPIARDLRGNDSLTGITLVLRTRDNPAGYAPLVRQAIRGIDPTLAIFDVRTMEAHLSQALFLPRAAAFLFGFAGFTAKPHIQLAELTGQGPIFACGTPASASTTFARFSCTSACSTARSTPEASCFSAAPDVSKYEETFSVFS